MWQIIEARQDFGSTERMVAESDLEERPARLADAYYGCYPEEIDALVRRNRRSLEEWRGALLESEPRGDDTRRSTTSVGGSPPRALRVGVGRVPLRALRRDINARLGQFSEEEAVPVHEDVGATLDRAMAAAGKPALKPMRGSPAPSSGRGASGSRARHSMWSSW